MRGAPADSPVVAVKLLRIAVGVERRGGVVLVSGCVQPKGKETHARIEDAGQVV
jgi:hypothetical protein